MTKEEAEDLVSLMKIQRVGERAHRVLIELADGDIVVAGVIAHMCHETTVAALARTESLGPEFEAQKARFHRLKAEVDKTNPNKKGEGEPSVPA